MKVLFLVGFGFLAGCVSYPEGNLPKDPQIAPQPIIVDTFPNVVETFPVIKK